MKSKQLKVNDRVHYVGDNIRRLKGKCGVIVGVFTFGCDVNFDSCIGVTWCAKKDLQKILPRKSQLFFDFMYKD